MQPDSTRVSFILVFSRDVSRVWKMGVQALLIRLKDMVEVRFASAQWPDSPRIGVEFSAERFEA